MTLAIVQLPKSECIRITEQDGQLVATEGTVIAADYVFDAQSAFEQLRNAQTATMANTPDLWASLQTKWIMHKAQLTEDA